MANSKKGAKTKSTASKSKKNNTKTPEKKQQTAPPLRREIGGIFLIFVAAVVIVSFFEGDGIFSFVKTVFMGALGKWGYWVSFPCLVLAGFVLLTHRGKPVKFRVFSALILPILLANMINIFQEDLPTSLGFPNNVIELWMQGTEGTSGGIFGGIPYPYI